jgi:hypothetical protein
MWKLISDPFELFDYFFKKIFNIVNIEISILQFDTIQMDKNVNIYFVYVERRILKIMSISFCIPIQCILMI